MEQLNCLQQLRYDLIKGFGMSVENAKKAFDFIIGENAQPIPETKVKIVDGHGVFLLYEDGHIEPFNGENSKDGAIAVVAKYGDLSVRLHPCDLTDVSMETSEEDESLYLDWYDKAAEDFKGPATTKRLIELGLKIDLPEGTYIPSAGELYLMYALKRKLDAALTYIGQEPFADEWYWSCSVRSATYAWGVRFDSGYLHTYTKTNEGRVRPVSAF